MSGMPSNIAPSDIAPSDLPDGFTLEGPRGASGGGGSGPAQAKREWARHKNENLFMFSAGPGMVRQTERGGTYFVSRPDHGWSVGLS